MKNLLLTTVFSSLACIGASIGQVNISCNFQEICAWNSTTESFDRCFRYEENSIFRINEEETMFTHITETIKSAYYINNKKQDSDTDVWILYVQSDVGNSYIYFLDFDHKEIRVAAESDGEIIMIRFYIKRVWVD